MGRGMGRWVAKMRTGEWGTDEQRNGEWMNILMGS